MDPKPAMLVAFSGLAGCGKSAIAMQMCGAELGFIRMKFADPIKEMLRELLYSAGVPANHLEKYIEGDLKEVPTPFLLGKSPRDLMITLGSEWGRDMVHPDLWVHLWSRRVRVLMDWGNSVVVDDLRFPNEALAVRALGGIIIHVERETQKVITHKSEGYVPQADYHVDNNGELTATVREIMSCLNI